MYEKRLKKKDGDKQISGFLQGKHPGKRGFSVRSVERFCSNKDIHKTLRNDEKTLDDVLSTATDMVSIVA